MRHVRAHYGAEATTRKEGGNVIKVDWGFSLLFVADAIEGLEGCSERLLLIRS